MAPVRVQVSCINKADRPNPHERIQFLGGLNPDGSRWMLSETDAILDITNQIYGFFVSVGGQKVDVVIATHLGREYLKTTADDYAPNNLLSLPECPTTAFPPPPPPPISWQPSVLAPVFYGIRDYAPGLAGGALSTACRVFFPSLDGAVDSAPLLEGCGLYPLIVLVHGSCPSDTEHYKKWFVLPVGLARSGYVVVVPELPGTAAGDLPSSDPSPDLDLLTNVLTWMRTGWEHSSCLLPPPHTGIIGHSYGALLGARLAAGSAVSAYASLSGVWHAWPSSSPRPIQTLTVPKLFAWGAGVEDFEAPLTGTGWTSLSTPKHSVAFDNGDHWSYGLSSSKCSPTSAGLCGHVANRTMDIVEAFFGKYLAPEHWPQLLTTVPNHLIIHTPLVLTHEQEFFVGGHLMSMSNDFGPGCRFKINWETGADSGSLIRS